MALLFARRTSLGYHYSPFVRILKKDFRPDGADDVLLCLPGLDIKVTGSLATESVVLVARMQTWSQSTPLNWKHLDIFPPSGSEERRPGPGDT